MYDKVQLFLCENLEKNKNNFLDLKICIDFNTIFVFIYKVVVYEFGED